MFLHHSTPQDSDGFEWKEIAPGQWMRPLDSIEKFFYSASSPRTPSDLVHNMVTVGAKLPSSLYSHEELAIAWQNLRYSHPRIACTVVAGNLYYKIPNKEDLQEWTLQTLKVDTSGRSGRELTATLKSSPTGVLLILPPTREIIFQIPHYHIDGVGAMQFLDSILDVLRGPPKQVQFGDEHRNLSESLTKIFNRGPPTMDNIRQAHQLAQDFRRGLPSIDLGVKEVAGPKHTLQMERITFSMDETAAICAKTKENNFTITHVCHSAMVQSIRSGAEVKSSNYTSFFFISCREQLHTQCDRPKSPVCLRLTVLPSSLLAGPEQGFTELAQGLKKIYTTIDKSPQHTVLHGPMYNFLGQRPASLSNHANVFLSSLGVVERQIMHSLDDFWIGASSATPDITAYVWTFENRLTFAVWFNTAYHQKLAMSTFLQLMRYNVLSGLGLDIT